MEYQLFTLANGIRVVHQQVDSPVAHFGVVVNTGSRDEEEHEQGMAHFIEHTLFKGTRKRKAYQIINRIEDVGGELNAYTTKEETAIYATFLSEYYSRTIELISDIVVNAAFPEKEIELEKEVVVEEINSYNDSPAELIYDEFEELIYNGHPIARNILGTPETVRAFSREKIKSFIKKNYHTHQMVICSVGNIQAAKFEKLVKAHFDILPEKNNAPVRKPFSGYIAQSNEVVKDTFQSHCIVGAEAYHIDHNMRLPLVLLNNILGGNSMNSKLNMSLREKHGLVYNVEANYTPYTDTGIFTVYFGTERSNLYKAFDLVMKEFKWFREQKMKHQTLERAKKQLIGQLAISNENREDLMLTIGRSYLYFNKIDTIDAVIEKINNITPDDIFQVSNEILVPQNLSKLIFL
ncbi:MAG: insulinase family protein [Prolixibacteraceae bacterium]|nr:insulinase family protein [Prolixibacteraceae bacterium]